MGDPRRYITLLLAPLTLSGCVEIQSALSPEGPEAGRIALLFWVMTGGSAIILIVVIMLAIFAIFGGARARELISREGMIVGGGIVFPVFTLTALLVYGLVLTSAGPGATGEGASVRISVIGEQWWWRVIYTDAQGRRIESANELRLPVNRPVLIELTSADVIHSFWIPKLAGKLDMIPGRKNMLRLTASKAGISRGQCAEYCGGAHALMSFYVIAMPEADFDAWLAREAANASTLDGGPATQGAELFLKSGCGACHAIRGTASDGTIGPDLTHVGSRMSLAAAALPNDAQAFAQWIEDNQRIKPENKMPAYRIFTPTELAAIAAYLESLK